MKINDRLKKIGDLVEANSFCLDIGCDHAFLDIYLVKKNKNIKAIASDINEGPVKIAKENIKNEKLTNQIEVRLGDGLDTYTNDIDTVIISGMGGRNMIGIFQKGKKYLKDIKTIIISPNNYQSDIKKFLTRNGYYIENEEFVKEKKFIYQIIVFKQGYKKYSAKDYFFGPIFLKNKDKLFKEYYTREKLSREILLKLLPKNYILRRFKLNHELKILNQELRD